MILTDTINQPKALGIYAILGAIFGILYSIDYFTCSYVIKARLFRHISQSTYVIIYGITFFMVTYAQFDYDLKIYHALISTFFTALTAIALYLPLKKHNSALTAKFDAVRTRISQSKFAKRFKK